MPEELKRKKGPPKVFVHTVEGHKIGLAADFEKVNEKACFVMDDHVRKIFNMKSLSQTDRVDACLKAFVHKDYYGGIAKEFLTRAVERWDKGKYGAVFKIVFDEKKQAPMWTWKTKEKERETRQLMVLVDKDPNQDEDVNFEPLDLNQELSDSLAVLEGNKPTHDSAKDFRKGLGRRMFQTLSDSSKPVDKRIHDFMKEFLAPGVYRNLTLQMRLKEAIVAMDEQPGYQPFTLGYQTGDNALIWKSVRPLPDYTRYLEFDDGSKVALPSEISVPLAEAHEKQKKALADGKKVNYSEAAVHMAKSVESQLRQFLSSTRLPTHIRLEMCWNKFVHETYCNSPQTSIFKEAAERFDKDPDAKVFNIRFEPRTGNLRWKSK